MGRNTASAMLMRISLMLFLITGLVLINGCGKQEKKGVETMTVKKGDKVKVQYTGTLKDGTVFDKSKEEEPLEFTVGSGEVIPGFDKAIVGMKLNEEKKITIKAEDAYGKRDEALVMQFPRNSLPKDFNPEIGMIIRLQDKDGRLVPGTIVDITENNVTIDLNHPLAGKDLTFDIKVIGIE